MRIIRGIDDVGYLGPTVVTIGSFDGVHSGHAAILSSLTRQAKLLGVESTVVSFTPHPRVTLGRADGLELLSSDEEKAILLSEAGVSNFVLLEFDGAFSQLSYADFVESYLVDRLNMRALVVGFNHHMGHNRGDFSTLQPLAKRLGFEVVRVEEHVASPDLHVSSTSIRRLLSSGNIDKARTFMSHPYLMVGYADSEGVVSFDEPLKLIPPAGSYAAVINGELQDLTIDLAGRVSSGERDKKVKIQL